MKALLDRFDLTLLRPIPFDFKPIPAIDEERALAAHAPYPPMAGPNLYAATILRPDLSYYAEILARYLSKWNLEYYKAAKHLLRYIRGSPDLSLTFDANLGRQ